ncbi:hypothetical protein [Ornithobacterium rhinotracheale]|uniref:hypothetical protein n=1 Tax=Ornithobacterium rhinotracheale TaxID=28251 RepID=UPI0040361CBD
MNKIIAYYQKIKKWAVENPKKVFKVGMISLSLFFVISVVQFFYHKDDEESLLIPSLYQKSDVELSLKSQERANKNKEIKKIVSELNTFREKREQGILTKSDSLRIDFLYNQYQKLSNEK